MITLPQTKREIFASAVLGVVSAVAYGSAFNAVMGPFDKPVVSARQIVEQTKRESGDKLTIIMLRRNECAECPAVMDAFNSIKYKTDIPFTIKAINADQNPDVAKGLQQKDPLAPAIFHVFHKGVKIHESIGVSSVDWHLQDYLEMVDALARGQVTSLKLYEPPKP